MKIVWKLVIAGVVAVVVYNAATFWIKQIDNEVHVLVAGSSCDDVSKETASVHLVKKVLVCDSPNYQNYLPENLAPLVAKISEKYDHIVASANTFGKNFMPRVAAALDVSQVSDIIKVDSPDTLKDVTDAIPPITLVDIPDFIEKSELDAGVPEMEETTLIAFPCPTLTLVKLF